jgi:hypothetical protein
MATGKIVLDEGYLIISEYERKLRSDGQGRTGDAFLKWVYNYQWNPRRCDRVRITPTEDSNNFAEFPDDADLKDFDRSDRKFIAVANAHPGKPSILQASDSKWWGWKDALLECGIKVEFLCPAEIEEAYNRKFGQQT